jgi:hypothetical protein
MISRAPPRHLAERIVLEAPLVDFVRRVAVSANE